MFTNILVPFDGSSTAERALRLAIGMAGQEHAKLTLFYVLNENVAMGDMQMAPPSLYRSHLEGLRRRGNEVLEQARIIASSAGVEPRLILCETAVRRAAEAICEEATKGYDVVVIGTHGRRGLQKLVLGSDAEAVSRTCIIPVILVPGASTSALASSYDTSTQTLPSPQEAEPLILPPARPDHGMLLSKALKLRCSTRIFDARPLQPQALSDLLWSAFGVNRANGDRTAPYWRHVMAIDIYVATAEGTWVYEPGEHRLLPWGKEDIRASTGTQDFVGVAPVNLIYVAHGERMMELSKEERRLYASVDAAFIGQNVYLFCASEGLGCVFRGALDATALGRLLRLPEGQFVTFAQTVGFAPA
ncbi:universal stress protein [Polaromonas sp. C04]|uniref:universal stress protein n=1 Tax=Polaromonas sp. C04 TaxID=1945857 RepID=UPI00098662DF|nr:universal stress protein [Polaromonas sp. C04]